MAPEPPAREALQCNKHGVHNQYQPKVSSTDHEERHVNADVIGSVRQSHQCDGCDIEIVGQRLLRFRSPRLQHLLDLYCERQEIKETHPSMRYS